MTEKQKPDNKFLIAFLSVLVVAVLLAFCTSVVVAGAHVENHQGPVTLWDLMGSWRDQWLVILTGALAVATFLLFSETQRTAKQADLHHRQSQAGIMALNKLSVVTGEDHVQLYGDVQNVGFGPALQVRLMVTYPQVASDVRMLGTFGPGVREHLSNQNLEGNVLARVALRGHDPTKALKNEDAVVRLDWHTIFNHEGWCEYYHVGDGAFAIKTIQTPED